MNSQRHIERINSISEFHQTRGLIGPKHPLISVVDYSLIDQATEDKRLWTCSLFVISLKKDVAVKYRYGQSPYDFDEGIMNFFAPNQLFYSEVDEDRLSKKPNGYLLLIHPDFFWNTSLAKKIQDYDFFDYALNEALFLSENEEQIIGAILKNIALECEGNMDKHSKNIVISQIELLLNYAARFYGRQFITREKKNHEILTRFNELLDLFFKSDRPLQNGLLTVKMMADQLNYSPVYLSKMLKHLVGQNAQQIIQNKIIEIAKEKLSSSQLSVAEIAYGLGFEHPQSFSKLFKSKTNLSPLSFRQLFN
jgi:AraC family transcriptional regulator, transcriptional activator of pobA